MSGQPSPSQFVPVLPENAPFTPEQRAYLNGFLAGLFSRSPVSNAAPTPGTHPAALIPITILFGSQTGTAEKLAKRVAKEAGKRGFAPTIHDLAQFSPSQLAQVENALILTSTYGDGEPPDNARSFWDALKLPDAPVLPRTRFSVLALGDSNYAKFCGFGKEIDERLASLGATRTRPRQECDVDYEEPFLQWMNSALQSFASASTASSAAVTSTTEDEEAAEPRFNKKNPFPARLITNRTLNTPGSAKEVRHFEIDLEGSDLVYEVGDALGVMPTNDPALVQELIESLGLNPNETLPTQQGQPSTLVETLTRDYDITKIPKPFLQALAEKTGDSNLQKLSAPDANGELSKFLWGREIIDLIKAHPAARFSPSEFLSLLKKLQPRLYSISSSPKAHPGQVHLTVGIVKYDSLGRKRQGVCSNWLAYRVGEKDQVPVFVHSNPAFRPPSGDTPLIMVGPGTGIAPFRAFLEERRAQGSKGRSWLFFGDQHAKTDFLYREEMEAFQKDGLLTRLDLAWSRDQAEKIYVQQRMLENAAELYAWLEAGGAFYVCGDASRMARDVDAALHQTIEMAGGKTADQAAEYVKQLKAQKRYLRDVY